MGKSDMEAPFAVDVHWTSDDVAGWGGRLAGDKRECVAARVEGARFGGIRKWSCFSLNMEDVSPGVDSKIPRTYMPTTKNATSVLGHHSTEPTLPLNFHDLTTLPTVVSHMLTTPLSSPLAAHMPSGLMLRLRTRAFSCVTCKDL